MGTQGESRLSKRIIDAVTARGAFAYKNHGSAYMPTGLPDVHCTYFGYSIWFETKMPEGKDPTPAQLNMHRKIRAAGGKVYVPRSVPEALAVLDRIDALRARRSSAQRRSQSP